MNDRILDLPWEVQLALGSGYLAYALAYSGIRDHHKTIDVVFRTIAFGLCATVVLAILPTQAGWVRYPFAVIAALAFGVIWRCWGADGFVWLARKFNVSWSDETPSAWSRLTQHNRRMYYSGLTVQLDDDRWLFCSDTRAFSDAPFGPCILGPNGDLALYVTHKCEPDGEIVEVSDVRDPHHGDEITYVPASRVRLLRVRLWRNSSGSAEEVVECPPAGEAAP